MSLSGTEAKVSRFGRLAAPFRAAFGAALNVALPPLCPACRELVGGSGLCASCWSKLSLIAPPYCERLGIPFVYDPARAFFPCRRSPIRPHTTGRALRCATTRSRARWCIR